MTFKEIYFHFTVIGFLGITAVSCNKNDKNPEPDYAKPDISIERINSTDYLEEGSADTVYFKLSIQGDFPGDSIEVSIDFGALNQQHVVDMFLNPLSLFTNNGGTDRILQRVFIKPSDPVKMVGMKVKDNSFYEAGKVYQFKIVDVIYWYDGLGKVRDDVSGSVSFDYVDNDLPPIIGFDHSFGSTLSVQENNGQNLWVRVYLNTVSGLETKVDFSAANGTAEGVDYVIKSASPLIIPAGMSYADIKFDIINDAVYEGVEDFTFTLSNPQNSTLGYSGNSITLRDYQEVAIFDEEDQ